MLSEEAFAASMAIINGVLQGNHKVLENNELNVYYETLKNEIDNEHLFIESIKDFVKKWASAYKRPTPYEILKEYEKFKKEKEFNALLDQHIKTAKKLNAEYKKLENKEV